jgi:Arc/MetJ-type ribon-helix-helix transcriptional regulator
MSIEISHHVECLVRDFVARGLYSNEAEVFEAAMQALENQERDLEGIRRGIEDESAGRVAPARQVVEAAKRRLGRSAK